MKKGVNIFLISVSIVILLLIGTLASVGVFMNHPSGERDVSWIDNVEDIIEEVKDWEPIENNPDIGGYNFRLFENGNLETIYKVSAEDRDDSYVAYFRGHMYKINNIINSSVSDELYTEILEKNKVLMVSFGGDTKEVFWRVNAQTTAFFILEVYKLQIQSSILTCHFHHLQPLSQDHM